MKSVTRWLSNATKESNVPLYSDSTITYSSSTVAYSNANGALADDGKLAASWADMPKNSTAWAANPLSVSTDTYDPTGTTYDAIYAYFDGNQDTTQSPIDTNVATVWNEA